MPAFLTAPTYAPIFLLLISNVFMNFAWYGNLRFPPMALWQVILISWFIALVEYCFAIPANRIGAAVYKTAELKIMQEVISMAVFCLFSVTYLREKLTIDDGIGFVLIGLGAYFVIRAPTLSF